MLLLKNKSVDLYILVLVAFDFIGMFDFYWELLHVSYAQVQTFDFLLVKMAMGNVLSYSG